MIIQPIYNRNYNTIESEYEKMNFLSDSGVIEKGRIGIFQWPILFGFFQVSIFNNNNVFQFVDL